MVGVGVGSGVGVAVGDGVGVVVGLGDGLGVEVGEALGLDASGIAIKGLAVGADAKSTPRVVPTASANPTPIATAAMATPRESAAR